MFCAAGYRTYCYFICTFNRFCALPSPSSGTICPARGAISFGCQVVIVEKCYFCKQKLYSPHVEAFCCIWQNVLDFFNIFWEFYCNCKTGRSGHNQFPGGEGHNWIRNPRLKRLVRGRRRTSPVFIMGWPPPGSWKLLKISKILYWRNSVEIPKILALSHLACTLAGLPVPEGVPGQRSEGVLGRRLVLGRRQGSALSGFWALAQQSPVQARADAFFIYKHTGFMLPAWFTALFGVYLMVFCWFVDAFNVFWDVWWFLVLLLFKIIFWCVCACLLSFNELLTILEHSACILGQFCGVFAAFWSILAYRWGL